MSAQERLQTRYAARTFYGRTLKFLKHLISRIDLSNFPGSCCG
jgi:hypothetical protein